MMLCRKCDSYHATRERDTNNLSDEGEGQCRAMPPKIFIVPVQSIQGHGMAFSSQFPSVTGDCWCAEFSIFTETVEGDDVDNH